jgi:hypothetical protein
MIIPNLWKQLLGIVVVCLALGCEGNSLSRTNTVATKHWESQAQKFDAIYDLRSLTFFLREFVRLHPSVEGVEISKTRILDTWLLDTSWLFVALVSGDWIFQSAVEPDEFTLSYQYAPEMILTCRFKLVRRGHYSFLSAIKEKIIHVTNGRLGPWPN